jgi:hypothetical protein
MAAYRWWSLSIHKNCRPTPGSGAASVYFLDTTLAGAFVARWCGGYRVETAGGVFQVRDDDPAPRVGPALHRTP